MPTFELKFSYHTLSSQNIMMSARVSTLNCIVPKIPNNILRKIEVGLQIRKFEVK